MKKKENTVATAKHSNHNKLADTNYEQWPDERSLFNEISSSVKTKMPSPLKIEPVEITQQVPHIQENLSSEPSWSNWSCICEACGDTYQDDTSKISCTGDCQEMDKDVL